MNQVKSHYDNHLGYFYSWMVGDFITKCDEQKKFFSQCGISPRLDGLAIDLGCGHGLQSVALAKLGFKVAAIDFNNILLNELNERAVPGVNTLAGDLLQFDHLVERKAELVVCMGDTLTHLNSQEEVAGLISKISKQLVAGGKFVCSFRDLSTPLEHEQRFLPVRSDDSRIHTCFLEYFADHVQVYDLLHEKTDGGWKQSVSSYPKLILTAAMLKSFTHTVGLSVIHEETINRMIYLVMEKSVDS